MGFRYTLPRIWDPGTLCQEYEIQAHSDTKNMVSRHTLPRLCDPGTLCQEYGHSAKNMVSRHTLPRIWDPGSARLAGNGHTGRGTKKQASAVSEHFNTNTLRQDKVLSGQVLDTLQVLGITPTVQDEEDEEEEELKSILHQKLKFRGK